MSRFLASIRKEILLISRDWGGLLILFIMPLLLVITVTLLQDGTFRNITEQKTAIILVDNDHGTISQHIRKSMEESGFFTIFSDDAIRNLDEKKAKKIVREGTFPIAIVLPADLSEDLESEVKQKVDRILSAFMEDTTDEQSIKPFETKEIHLYFDPTLPLSFKEMVKTHIDKMMYQVENQFIYTAFERELGEGKQLPFSTGGSLVTFTEINPTSVAQIPNSVQHNVPAWTLFAIFFITIPLSTNIVKERTQGTYIRLSTSPLSYGELLLAKVFVFLCISLLQFSLMLAIGMYIFPYLGLPPLEIEGRIKILSLIALGAGLAAIGIGVLLGTLCRTQEQSAPLGATLTVILAAIGGIWIPIFVMPPFMQTIAKLSPMNWALQAFYEVLLRQGSFLSVLPKIGYLGLFFISCIIISILYGKTKRSI
jgi:ABC-2 type transporter